MSLSEYVEFDDLDLLDGGDLRAVFSQVSTDQVLEALAGSSASLRHQLLAKLSGPVAVEIEAQVVAHGPVSLDSVRQAQQAVLEALQRLSHTGIVAFDDPADMMVA
jgi:flagellar motor switch protein FliG